MRAFNLTTDQVAAIARGMPELDQDRVLRLLELANNGTISLGEAVARMTPIQPEIATWLGRFDAETAVKAITFLMALLSFLSGPVPGKTWDLVERLARDVPGLERSSGTTPRPTPPGEPGPAPSPGPTSKP